MTHTRIHDAYLLLTDDYEPISYISFTIQSNANVLKESVTKSSDNDEGLVIPDSINNGMPIHNGSYDRRLGTTENMYVCATCLEGINKCPGHTGHVTLVKPVWHIGFLNYARDILRCMCFKCKRLLLHRNEKDIASISKIADPAVRYKKVVEKCKSIYQCQAENTGCGTPAHAIVKDKSTSDGGFKWFAEVTKANKDTDESKSKSIKYELTPQAAYEILKYLSDDDHRIMGLTPDKFQAHDLIISNFLIPQVNIRHTNIVNMVTKDNDLTVKINDIIKVNNVLRTAKGSGTSETRNSEGDFSLLQYNIITYYSNNVKGIPKSIKYNSDIQSLTSRYKGKKGRIRGDMVGKRVNLSARGVIASNPNIPLNCLSVPLSMAKILTVAEVVNEYNIVRLQAMIENGKRGIWPGANSVTKTIIIKGEGNKRREEQKRLFILMIPKSNPIKLECGDIVDRHLIDGDIGIFNRQPSLHKLSMMGHVLLINQDPNVNTFGMNTNATEGYNADFDGDEMNLHIPQSPQARNEVRLIMNIMLRFINPLNSKLAVIVKQDSLMGSSRLVHPKIRITWNDMMNIITKTSKKYSHNVTRLPEGQYYQGRQVFSAIIPKASNGDANSSDLTTITKRAINMKLGNKPDDIEISNSMFIKGFINKSNISTINNRIWFQNGPLDTMNFIDDIQQLTLQFLAIQGATVALSDIIITKHTKQQIHDLIDTKIKDSQIAITKYENDPNSMSKAVFETNFTENLKSVQNSILDLLIKELNQDDMGYNNGFYTCITSESSGASQNLLQVSGSLLQLLFESKRISLAMHGNRVSPAFAKHDHGARAGGYCTHAFIDGLDPHEFFAACQAGSEGVINTAIITAIIGYYQRKMINMMNDVSIRYDGTTRDASDRIIQYVYGDNNLNVEKQISQRIKILTKNNQQIRDDYCYTPQELKFTDTTSQDNETYYSKLITLRDRVRQAERRTRINLIEFKDQYPMPVDLNSYIFNITSSKEHQLNRANESTVTASHVHRTIEDMLSTKLHIINIPKSSVFKKLDNQDLLLITRLYIYDVLSPKLCTSVYKLTTLEFNQVISHFILSFKKAKSEAGDAVGTMAAQSNVAPMTQATMKSFQKAGMVKSATSGLDKVTELFNVTENIKTPTMTIILKDQFRDNRNLSSKLTSSLKYTTLSNITETASIVYDPFPTSPDSITQKDNTSLVFANPNCNADPATLQWVIRIVLSKEKKYDNNVSMLDIKSSFCHNWDTAPNYIKTTLKDYKPILEKVTKFSISSNYDNSPIPIVHIRFDFPTYHRKSFTKFLEMVMTKFKINGINEITDSYMDEQAYQDFDQQGNQVERKQFVITTYGYNIHELSTIRQIDLTQTTTNDIRKFKAMYGIEAVRKLLYQELVNAMGIDSSTNPNHLYLLVDCMTYTGDFVSIARAGIIKMGTDVLAKAAFETPIDILNRAAMFNEMDQLRTLVSQIMYGKRAKIGTGAHDLLLDHHKIINAQVEQDEQAIVIKKTTFRKK